jgi:YegS/Rv2252/BmrU family lipid kinase
MKVLIIDNANHKRGKELRRLITKKYPSIEILTTTDPEGIPGAVDYVIKNKINLLISSGGDGSINHLINEVMTRKEKLTKKILFAVLPCGKANDLARRLNLPQNFDKALSKILNGKRKKLDLVKVNNKYFITGGGFGLPSEVIEEKNRSNFSDYWGDKVYLFEVLKLFLFGYDGIMKIKIGDQIYENVMLFSVMNQPFIGKRFFLNPDAKQNDGFFDTCIINKGKNTLSELLMLNKVINKEHKNYSWAKIDRIKDLEVTFDKERYFMADGELLEYSNKFKFSIVPEAISFRY